MGFGFQIVPVSPQYIYIFPCSVVRGISSLMSVCERVGGPQSSAPFSLTSLLARLILFVSVYKRYTLRQPAWGEKEGLGAKEHFFVYHSHTFPLLRQRGEALEGLRNNRPLFSVRGLSSRACEQPLNVTARRLVSVQVLD